MGCFYQERLLTCKCAEQCWGYLGSSNPWASLAACSEQGIVSSSGLFSVQTKCFSDAEFICLRKCLFEAVHPEKNNSQSRGSAGCVSTGVAQRCLLTQLGGTCPSRGGFCRNCRGCRACRVWGNVCKSLLQWGSVQSREIPLLLARGRAPRAAHVPHLAVPPAQVASRSSSLFPDKWLKSEEKDCHQSAA